MYNINKNIIITVILLTLTFFAQGQDSTDKYKEEIASVQQQANAFLSTGEYEAALNVYKHAARKYPRDMALRNRFAELSTIIKLRVAIKQDDISDQQWHRHVAFMRNYYYKTGLYRDALINDQLAYEKEQTAPLAENLLESLSLLDMNEKAGELIVGISEPSLRIQTMALLLRARNGQPQQALKQFDSLNIDHQLYPLCLFDLARISVLAGNDDKWINALIYALRYSDTLKVISVREMATSCTEFKELQEVTVFQQILQTPSRVDTEACPISKDCDDCLKK